MTIYEGRESPFFFNVITVYPDNVKPPNHINDWKCGINISMRTNPTQMGENTREHEFNTKHWSKKKTIAYEKKKNKISLNMFVYPALRECQRQQFCEGGTGDPMGQRLSLTWGTSQNKLCLLGDAVHTWKVETSIFPAWLPGGPQELHDPVGPSKTFQGRALDVLQPSAQ